jgi:NAD(P)-dependent dehydrogenase (short-subunit alcohol dehydrogenase family)
MEVDEDAWRSAWELKVFGYINMTRAFYRLMAERGHGVILNNIGIGGENFDFDYIAGSTGNAALMAFTRALGGRSLKNNVRVVGINPGVTATERSWNHLKKRAADRCDAGGRGVATRLPVDALRRYPRRDLSSRLRDRGTPPASSTVDGGQPPIVPYSFLTRPHDSEPPSAPAPNPHCLIPTLPADSRRSRCGRERFRP